MKTSGSLVDAFHREVDQKIWEVLEFDSNFKIMSIILTYDETGGQEEGPKCQDGLKLLMSNASVLETPKKKKELTVRLLNGCILYTHFYKKPVKEPSTKSFLFGFLNLH